MTTLATRIAASIWCATGAAGRCDFSVDGSEGFRSAYAVSDLAAGTIGAAGAAATELIEASTGRRPGVTVDRRRASLWFGTTIRPEGWTLPPSWDDLAGDYRTADGWIRLHTNAPNHRAAMLRALDLSAAADRAHVASVVAGYQADALETAVVAADGCAAAMRSTAAWAAHPQGRSIAAEPVVHWATHPSPMREFAVDPTRPLAGLRVLDLTRVLAGPAATRLLAGLGADVLRIDPPFWVEAALEPEMTLGKRCAGLDLRRSADRETWLGLLATTDILVHGYRPGALDRLGLGTETRRLVRPDLIDISLDAYGWSGPWAGRRGFDSLVQMSCGIADAGMRWAAADKPTPLPVQALDHATGYILATAALRALTQRLRTGAGTTARASLARTAVLLMDLPVAGPETGVSPVTRSDEIAAPERTAWGPAYRLRPPLAIEGAPLAWDHPAGPLRSSHTDWVSFTTA